MPVVGRLEVAEAEIAAATSSTPLAGIVEAPDPAAVWAGLEIGRRRAVLDCRMTVTVLPVIRPGRWFDPDTIPDRTETAAGVIEEPQDWWGRPGGR